jgi:uncharacterized membrane protein
MAPALDRNIHALRERAKRERENMSAQERVAQWFTDFAGSMVAVYVHLAVFGAWIVLNLGVTPIPPWDPSLVVLAMIASVEAIFLTTFVLISQNRMSEQAAERAELDLQTSLLTEHEVTKMIAMIAAIAKKLDVTSEADAEVEQLKRNVAPEAVLDRIEQQKEEGERP